MKASMTGRLARLGALLTTTALASAALIGTAAPAHAAVLTIQGTITGRTTPTGAPKALSGIFVSANTNDMRADQVSSATTGADGKFSITVPAGGGYKIYANCSSLCDTYVGEWFNNHSSAGQADPVTVSATAPTATANIELGAYGKISGRVTDKNGAALPASRVYAGPAEGGQGYYATPDANGYYTLAKVPAGKVNLSVEDTSGKHLFTSQFWNGTSGVEQYVGFTMGSGAVLSNVNFALNPQTVLDMAVTDTAGKPLPEIGFTPYVYNEAAGTWDPPQYGPLLSDSAGRIYWNLTVGKKYKICLRDEDYQSHHEFRYAAECYDNAQDVAGAKVITATSLGQRINATVQLELAGRGLDQARGFVYGGNQPGQSLTVDPGTWGPAPVALSYQWKRSGPNGSVDIAGATSSSYVLSEADRDSHVSVTVTGSKDGYVSSSWGSGGLKVGAPAVTASKALTLSGAAAVGKTLTADTGILSPAPEYDPMYEWLVNGVQDTRSYGNTFTLTPADLGKKITVRVSAYGWPAEPYYAQATSPVVAAGALTAPTPAISGTAKVGSRLTAAAGSWGPAPVTLAYQWLRSGAAIPGATASSYVLGPADLGKTITVRVTGSKAGYSTLAKTSAATAAVAAGTLTAPTPTITGTKKVGSTLTAKPGAWGPAPVTLKYQWYRGATAITGATTAGYKLVRADAGATLKVRVTGSKAGYTSVAKYSAATAKIAP